MQDANVTRLAGLDLRGLISNSLVEWDGRICAVVFTARCNWRCPYCHGAQFVAAPETLKAVDPGDVFALLEDQRGWIDGVAITGGEPTLQAGLVEFIRALRTYDVEIKLETNGTHPGVLETLLEEGLLECLCLDYKAPLDARLEAVTCVGAKATSLAAVQESFRLAAASGLEREYHTTLCPRYIDAATLAVMARALEPGGVWYLQQYELDERLDPAAAGDLRYDGDELERLAEIARQHHEQVVLRRGKGG